MQNWSFTQRVIWVALLCVGVVACRQEPTAVPPTPAPATPTPLPSPTAVTTPLPLLTAVPTPPPATATAVFPPPGYFSHVLGISQNEAGQTAVTGIIRNGNGPRLAELIVPGRAQIFNAHYAPATNQILYTDGARAAGPAGLAAGPLRTLSMSSGQSDTLILDSVVQYSWGPDGRAFAYILATDEAYQLRWRSAIGDDVLLATDVPRAFSIAPSGTQVAFTRESGYGADVQPGLYLVEIATREETHLSPVDRAGLGGSSAAWQPIWSPDESSLLLPIAAEDGPDFLWVTADGSAEVLLPAAALNGAIEAAWQIANPGSVRAMCADSTGLLLNGRFLISGIIPCAEQIEGPTASSHLVLAALDPQTGEVTVQELMALPGSPANLVAWETPGQAFYVVGEMAAVVDLPAAPAARSPATVAVDATTEPSPDGLWQVIYGYSEPVTGEDGGQVYRAYLAARRTDSSQRWTAVDQWRPHGLGLDYPAPLQWSGDGRYLYFTNRPIVDGCGPFANGSDLWRLDLGDGSFVQLVSPVGLSLALSPDGQTLAYIAPGPEGARRVVLREVATGAERAISLDDAANSAGNLVWSPDGARLLATVAYAPCLPGWTQALFLVDVAEETAVRLIEPDERRFTTLAWFEPEIARLRDAEGTIWLLNVVTTELSAAVE